MGAGRAQVSLSPSHFLNNRAVSTRLSEILPFSWETARLGWDLSLSSSLRKSHFPGTSAHSAPALEQSSPAKNCFQTPLQLINKELLVLSQLRAISPYVILFFFSASPDLLCWAGCTENHTWSPGALGSKLAGDIRNREQPLSGQSWSCVIWRPELVLT